MRKLAALAVIAFTVFCLVACDGMTSVGAFNSDIYTQEEFDEAVAVMQEYFDSNFEGCTLKEINYAGDDEVKAEAEYQGLDADQVIVIKTTFETDGEDHQNGLNPNETYEDYKWILTREAPGAPWEHKDHGYA